MKARASIAILLDSACRGLILEYDAHPVSPAGYPLAHACLILLFSVSEGSFLSICEAPDKGLNLLDVLDGGLTPTYSWT